MLRYYVHTESGIDKLSINSKDSNNLIVHFFSSVESEKDCLQCDQDRNKMK